MTQRKNLTGMVFGRLTVIGFNGIKNKRTMWDCRCSCGNDTVVIGKHLSSGSTKSCGCLQKERTSETSRKDISGRRFGRLLAIRSTEEKYQNFYIWECLCDCGNVVLVPIGSLNSGHTQSCGCLHTDLRKALLTTHGKSKTQEYIRAKGTRRREKQHGLDSGWTRQMEMELRTFFPVCVVCGEKDRLTTDHVYPLNKGHGLVPGNAVRLCVHCNSKKWTKTPEELPESTREKILNSAILFENHWKSIGEQYENY